MDKLNPKIIIFLFVIIFGGVFGLAKNSQAATYYIDYATGSDSNNGTSKATPWKHVPGMYGITGTAAACNPTHGDSFILKGGVTWSNAAFGMLWTWSGNGTTESPGCTGSGCIYIGVDQTWYIGGSWVRPIFDAGGLATTTRDGVANHIIRSYANYTIWDNIEIKGLYWSGTPVYGSNVCFALGAGSPDVGTNTTIENLYIHGWTHGTYAGGTHEHPAAIIGDTGVPNNNVNSIVKNCVVDGSDGDSMSNGGVFGGPPYIENNYFANLSNGIVANGQIRIRGNTILNINNSFDTTAHTNGIEVNASQNLELSNNVIGNLGTGTLGVWVAPYPGYTVTAYNNLIFNTDTGNVFDIAPAVYISGQCTQGSAPYCADGGIVNVYNNTIESGQDSNPNSVCFGGISSVISAVTLKNNHVITNATTPNGGLWQSNGVTPTVANNLIQTKTTANGQGYTALQNYPFSPTASGNGTVNAGADLSANCSSFPDLCNSTAVGVSYNATNHTVSSPNLAPTARTSWDIGAYEYASGGGDMTPPNVPTGLTVE